LDWVGFVVGVCAEAAPGPVFRLLYKACLDRVAMHVAEFLDSLCFAEDIEVVVTRLPDVVFCPCAGEALLEDLDS
jgi:hypothetical protein